LFNCFCFFPNYCLTVLFFLFCLVEGAVKNATREIILNARSFLDKSRLLSVIFGGSGSILGITVLGSELFVARVKSTHVFVYNTSNSTLTRNISITGSSYLCAIVASPRYNCLYISDKGLNVVHRNKLYNNVISKWSVGGWCGGLSLTSTDNVLVTRSDTKQIQEYTPDGRLIREINLNISMLGPVHSVQLSSDRFVVSHTGSLYRVCL